MEGAKSKAEARVADFLDEVSVIEKRDRKWTKDEQIDRLLKPGSKYLNLNPFEVLQIPPNAKKDVAKKAFRKLSILVHPDKNRDKVERAQQAFDAVNAAYQTINDEAAMSRVWEIFEEAKATLDKELKEKRKVAKKAGQTLPEDTDKLVYNESFRRVSCKLFADYEIRKQQLQERMQAEKKREREEQEEEAARKKAKQESEEAWEKNRDKRVDSWRDFANGGKKKKKKKKAIGLHKPPKLKTEQRK